MNVVIIISKGRCKSSLLQHLNYHLLNHTRVKNITLIFFGNRVGPGYTSMLQNFTFRQAEALEIIQPKPCILYLRKLRARQLELLKIVIVGTIVLCQAFTVKTSVTGIVLSTFHGLSYLTQNSSGMTTVIILFKCDGIEPQRPKKWTLK